MRRGKHASKMSNSESATYTNYGDVVWRAPLPSTHQQMNATASNEYNISPRSATLMLVDAVKIAESVVVREWLNAIYEMLGSGCVSTFDAEHFSAMLKINVAKKSGDYGIFSGLVSNWFGTHGGAVLYGRPSRDFATFTVSYSSDNDDTTTVDLLIIPPSANDSADASFGDTVRVVDAAARQTQSYVGNIHVVDTDMLDEIIAEQKRKRKQANGGKKHSKGGATPSVSGS